MRLTKMNGQTERAYKTIEEAISAVTFDADELNNKTLVSVGIGIDEEGCRWYAVGGYNEFTNCNYENLADVDSWYESDWIER